MTTDLRIKTKLALGFGVLTLLITVLAGVSVFLAARVDHSVETALQTRYGAVERLNAIKGDVHRTFLMFNDMLLLPASDTGRLKDEALSLRERVGEQWRSIEPLLDDAASKDAYAAVLSARQVFLSEQDAFLAAIMMGNDEEARSIAGGTLATARDKYLLKIGELARLQALQVGAAAYDTRSAVGVLSTAAWIGMAVALALGVALAVWTIRSVTLPLQDAIRIAQRVAAGDLSQPIVAKGRSETAQLLAALGEMQGSLAKVVAQVRDNADSVATASSQIAQGNTDLSSRTEEQASALQQTASSMKQLASTVQANADSAQQGNDMAASASAVASRGGQVVGEVVQTMRGIHESSQRIADIIGTIDGIAFQTNILALNAAVEAARAGEQGRGFAVVASEVRNLAQRSAVAAKEIKALISDSVQRVEQDRKSVV